MADESKIQEIVSAYPFKKGTTLSYTTLNQICEGLGNVSDGINTKQDVISDLETIRSGAALGATAVQPDVLQQQLSNYLTETEVKELIAEINSFEVEFVDVLPESGKTHTIYFVPAGDGVESDFYNEYMYINGKMELIGNTRIDLSGYYTKEETDVELGKKQNTLVAGTNIEISGDTISSKVYEASEFDIKDLSDETGLRTKWDGKQDAITDLEAIRSGAALGATAVQESDLQTALSGYYTSGKTDELLATKQDVISNLTEIEQNAASGKTAFDALITKQDVISDLDTIRSGAKLGGTAVQESKLNEALSAYFTSAQTMELIGEIDHFGVRVVDTLPVSGEPNTIYFVAAEGGEPTDAKNEYIYVEGIGWELIGTTRIDLTDYYTSGKTDELLATKQGTINDLDTIRSGAALGATAVQESDLQTALSGYYTSGKTDELLATKQDVLAAGSHIEISANTISVVDLSDVLYTSITHSELVSLVSNSGLTAGMKYRITDYVTTVNPSLSDVQSVGHVFDIIVEATDVDKLSENAKAIQSVRDTDGYFAEVNLNAWELKYCIDNDADKFAWADSTDGKGVIYWLKDEWNNECPYDFKNIQFKRWAITNITSDYITVDGINGLKNTYCKTLNGGKYYATKDAHGGWIPIDYYNKTEWVIDENDYTWYYTFHGLSSNDGETISEEYDMSIKVNKLTDECIQYLESVDSYSDVQGICKENQIQSAYCEYYYDGDCFKGRMVLNNIVFVNGLSYCYYDEDEENWMYQLGRCYGNKFGVECKNNTFGNYCHYNLFGNGCNGNTFGNSYVRNTIGNECYSNTFGNSCGNNTFGSFCRNNTFGPGCSSNTFGNSCYQNIFDFYYRDNIFGNDCYRNTFGKNCYNNTFGNYFSNNTFGTECRDNTFGNGCYGNTFGNVFQFNTFGNNCYDITIEKGYMKDCRFGDGVQYCTISNYSASSLNYLRNIVVLNGTKGNSSRQLLELNQNRIFNTHNIKQDNALAPQMVCGFYINENNVMTYIAKYYFDATLG